MSNLLGLPLNWLIRICVALCVSVSTLVALAFVAVQFDENLLRWHAEWLMVDMHRIRLYQSNWADAQRLMYRWGAWGHYDGKCDATDCRYSIQLTDGTEHVRDILGPEKFEWLVSLKAFTLYHWLGGRTSRITFTFVVHDGTIWRTRLYAIVEVPPRLFQSEDYDGALLVGAVSRQSLHDAEGRGHVFGRDEDLAQHPYYTAGRPGGCTSCMMVQISYSTRTPQAEIEQLTSLNLTCLTRFLFGCNMPDDLLPAAKEWRFYHEDEESTFDQQIYSSSTKACNIPVWALARDSGTVLVVDGLSVSQEVQDGFSREWATARVVTFLKGTPRWPVGSIIKIAPFDGQMGSYLSKSVDHLAPGRRYVILPGEIRYGEPEQYGPPDDTAHPEVALPRCGLQEDTDQIRHELEKGFAQNDNLSNGKLR